MVLTARTERASDAVGLWEEVALKMTGTSEKSILIESGRNGGQEAATFFAKEFSNNTE